jgi:ATP-dependent DNA helicase RecQ
LIVSQARSDVLSKLRNRFVDEPLPPDERFTAEATSLLKTMLGLDAGFRDGQLEAVHTLVEQRARLLVVQKTGWGKSLVYFIATRMLRDRGAGPTFLVSPLLSLMRNQEQMAVRIGVRALRLDSSNRDAWSDVLNELTSGQCDLLMVSPERLANQQFRTQTLPSIQRGIGMMVVDEAHCISDWGHDFRPDYRRIVQIVNVLPSTIPVLATTATANDRVVADIQQQLGDRLQVMRGPLARSTLRLQTIRLGSQAERLAWLAEHLPAMPGSGIIYCLTVRDTELVARWLQSRGVDVAAYHADLPPEERIEREQRLLANDVKGLAATVALGMGFDKPDLGFVMHFQRPGSVVAYYQQIGRAGRAGQDAYAILLSGDEDDDIQDFFITTAFPGAENLQQVVDALAASDGMTTGELERSINLSRKRIEQCLKFLEVEGAVVRDDRIFQRTPIPWKPDRERSEKVTKLRYHELSKMQQFVGTRKCLMEFVARELDDPAAGRCGRCANCAGDLVPRSADPALANAAAIFLGRSWIRFEPRKMLPSGVLPDRSTRKLDPASLLEPGLALCSYNDSGWGDRVRRCKYELGHFDDRLLAAARDAILATWEVDPATWWLAAVPSLRHPELVGDFAQRLATALGIPFVPALTKVKETAEQKTMQNSAQQFENVVNAFRAEQSLVQHGPVILIDDMVDSRWTLSTCGARLLRAGSGPVHPFALASFRPGA